MKTFIILEKMNYEKSTVTYSATYNYRISVTLGVMRIIIVVVHTLVGLFQCLRALQTRLRTRLPCTVRAGEVRKLSLLENMLCS